MSLYQCIINTKDLYTEIPVQIRSLNDKHRIITNINIENILNYKLKHPLFIKENIFRIFEEQSNVMEKPIISNLNLITEDNFVVIFNDIINIPNILTEIGIEAFIKLLFLKIKTDTNFTGIYTKMCINFSKLKYKVNDNKNNIVKDFLIEKLNITFNGILKNFNDYSKKESLNFVNFIGYLYNEDIIDNDFLYFLITKIINSNNYDILCNLIKVVHHKFKKNNTTYIKEYVNNALIKNNKEMIVQKRIKFMLEDILILLN